MKPIKVTFIDTASHGYYSVAKKDFLSVVGDPKAITGYSGHTLTRVYLEEDQDASVFFDAAKAKGIDVEVKGSYNPKFSISHNYVPALFAYVPRLGDEVQIYSGEFYKITGIGFKQMVVEGHGHRYGINLANPFKYITDARGNGVLADKVEMLAAVIEAAKEGK